MYSYSRQSIDADDIKAVIDTLQSDFLTQGPKVKEFEGLISNYIGTSFATCVNSATSALHTVLLGLGVTENSNVWVPGISFVATANSVEYCGAYLQFVDVNPETGNICLTALKDKLQKAKASRSLPDVLIIVDIAGRPCELAELVDLSVEFEFKIVHDASHSFGSEYNFRKVGSFPKITATVFSFHAVKPITTGEGGAICTHDPELEDKFKLISSHYVTRQGQEDPWIYDQIGLGYNFRMTDLQAALGTTQILKSDKFIEQKKSQSDLYTQNLSQLNEFIGLPVAMNSGSKSAHHLYQIRIKDGAKARRAIYYKLKAEGILSNVHYRPIYANSYFRKKYGKMSLKGCEAFYETVLALPLHPKLRRDDIDLISSKIVKICNEFF